MNLSKLKVGQIWLVEHNNSYTTIYEITGQVFSDHYSNCLAQYSYWIRGMHQQVRTTDAVWKGFESQITKDPNARLITQEQKNCMLNLWKS